MKNISVFFLFLLTTAGFAQGYYPLEIGNIWEYRDVYDNSYQYTIEVIGDTLMQNGIRYTHLKSKGNWIFDQYFRQSDSKTYTYLIPYDQQYLWYDFSKTTGDTVSVNVYGEDTTIITVLYDTVENKFGNPKRKIGFYEEFMNSNLDNLQEITDSIGLTYTESIEGDLFNYLSGAIINGIKYGAITNIEIEKLYNEKEFILYQNYPNPFNSNTIISFNLPQDENITIKVYDILGREVVTLYEGWVEKGLIKTSWNGNDSRNLNVGSGVYFFVIETGNSLLKGKMVLLR